MLNIINAIAIIVVMAIDFRPESLSQTLPIMVMGMVGIFLVIGVIVAVIYLINKVFSSKKK